VITDQTAATSFDDGKPANTFARVSAFGALQTLEPAAARFLADSAGINRP
jgi:hypothetical protein